MTVSTLRPSATTVHTGTVTGAASAHAALSDDSDSSYTVLDRGIGPPPGEGWQGDIGDLTLPTGAVIKSVQIRVRTATPGVTASLLLTLTSGGTTLIISTLSVSWSGPSTVVGGSLASAGITDAALDGALLGIDTYSPPGSQLVVYEGYVDVTHVAKPTVTVNLPTGTITNTNVPVVTWTPGLDSDGGAQNFYYVKIYDAATYGAGGFNPFASTPVVETGNVEGSTATSWQVTQPLADGTYRAYVIIGQTVNGALHLSDYAFSQFTVDVDLPGTPTLTATADNTNARIGLAVVDIPGIASTDGIEVQRSLDAGTTWETIRTVDGDGAVDVPWVAGVGEFSSSADATTHNLVLPAPTGGILANDLLIAVIAMDGNPTLALPSDWTEIKDEAGNGSAVRAGVMWKRAAGGESGTVALTTGASEGGGARILCVRDASTLTAPEVSTGVSSSAANANPDSLNPANWGTENTLWIAAMVNDGNVAVTAGPSNYYEFGNTRWANASGAGVATATRLALAASEDPGAFTHTLEDSRAFTIGVRPRNPTLTTYDYEAPNGTTMSYRARSLHDYAGQLAASAWATDTEAWTSTSWWLKHPHRPDLNVPVVVRSFQAVNRAGRQGVFQALGSSTAVVVSDTRGPKTGQVTLRSFSLANQDDLDALLDTVSTLMLQGPPGTGGPDYVRFGNHDRQRIVDWQDASRVLDVLDFTCVASPSGAVVAWP